MTLDLTGARFSAEYQLAGTETEARVRAESLCLDQTVELPSELVPPGPIRDQILGRVENFARLTSERYTALISFPIELVEGDLTQLLSVIFGICSLKPGIRVVRLHLPDQLIEGWAGPRFGRAGVRELVGVHERPLVCGVLKPLGLGVDELAELAYRLALGGVDLIKDDQGLADQSFCPFEGRVRRCTEAVARANRETGRSCLYFPHVSGAWDVIRRRALLAKQTGAGGVLVCPGTTGFEALRTLAEDDQVALPIMSHPGFLGSHVVHRESGIAPPVLFGQLPRLAGADVTIYPSYDKTFAITQDDCRSIDAETGMPWGHLKTIFPTAAGRITPKRVKELCDFYGNDVMFIVGGGFLMPGVDVVAACRTFMDQVIWCVQK